MKHPWILIILGMFVIIILMLTYKNNDENFLTIYEDTDTYTEALIKTGANKDEFTPYQKWVVYDTEDLNYVKKFHDEDYTGISTNPVVFERDWGEGSKVEWDQPLELDTDISLFEKDDAYLVILTFELPYAYASIQQTIGYIDVRHSNNFYISTNMQISYLDDDQEYVLYATALSTRDDNEMFPIYQNSTYINQIFKPSLIYTYVISIKPTSDNDLNLDMYLGMDIDFYMLDLYSNNSVQIGFNEFKASNDTFLVTRKSVQYRKEINS
jgi:K+ transporter